MGEVKRYQYILDYDSTRLEDSDTGEYVKFEDYEKLKAQLEKAEEALKYYCDGGNWALDYERTLEANENSINCANGLYTSILDDSEGDAVSLGHIVSSVGGKRAREYFKEKEQV